LNDLIPLTFDFPTAASAHKVLEQIVEIQCMLAKSTDYGLRMIDESELKIANTPDTHFLLQAELKAIKQGLEYEEGEFENGIKYKGYFNKDGMPEGVVISIFPDGTKLRGEYVAGKLHGIGKVTKEDGRTYWGEHKDNKEEGYGTMEIPSGNRYTGQCMQG
jgi:hypothetical protein